MDFSATPTASLTEEQTLSAPRTSIGLCPSLSHSSLAWGCVLTLIVVLFGWWNEWRLGAVDLVAVALLARIGFVQIRHAALSSLMAVVVWSCVRQGEIITLGHEAYARWTYFAFLWLVVYADPHRSRIRMCFNTKPVHHGDATVESTEALATESDQVESRRNRLVWFGVPLQFLLSARWDESFLAAIAILAIHTLGRAIDLWYLTGRWNEPLRDRLFCRSLWLTELAFAATLFTPRGPTLWIDLVERGLGRVSLVARAESLGTVLTSHAFAFCAAGLGLWMAVIHSRRRVLTADVLLVALFAIGLIWEPASVCCAVPILALVALPHLASVVERAEAIWPRLSFSQTLKVNGQWCAEILGELTSALQREDSRRGNVLHALSARWGTEAGVTPLASPSRQTTNGFRKTLAASLCQIALAGLLIGWCVSSYRAHQLARSRPTPRVRPLCIIPLPSERPLVSEFDLQRVRTWMNGEVMAAGQAQPNLGVIDLNLAEPIRGSDRVHATDRDARMSRADSENPRVQLVSHTAASPSAKVFDDTSLSPRGRLASYANFNPTAVTRDHANNRSCFSRLASLAQQGLTMDARCPGDSGLGTSDHCDVRDVWNEAIRSFRLPEKSSSASPLNKQQAAAIQAANRDLAEATIAFALVMPEARSWFDRDGQLVTFDLLAERLVAQSALSPQATSSTETRNKPLAGQGHYALSLLLRVDDQCGCLSRSVRGHIWNHLRRASLRFASTWRPREPWDAERIRPKIESTALSNRDDLDALNERAVDVVSTLEWWSIAPQGIRSDEAIQRQAVEWLIRYAEVCSRSHKALATSSPMRRESPDNSMLLRIERVLTRLR